MSKFYVVYGAFILGWFVYLFVSGTRLCLPDAGTPDRPVGGAAIYHK